MAIDNGIVDLFVGEVKIFEFSITDAENNNTALNASGRTLSLSVRNRFVSYSFSSANFSFPEVGKARVSLDTTTWKAGYYNYSLKVDNSIAATGAINLKK